jgi:elongation factor G
VGPPGSAVPGGPSVPAASDDAKFTAALSRCVAEDPTLRLERVPQTGQTILWCMGEGHRDATVTRLGERSGLAVEFEPVVTPLRSTFASAGTGTGRLVKQSGGHGQFAVCTIEVSPAIPGSGLTFIDRVVGGAIPRNYIPAVERGLRQAMHDGIISGQPLVDLEVTLVDGKAHSVDSSDMAFATAGALALKDAAEQAGLVTLEPVDAVEVEVPEDYLGAVMTDLAARRGRVTGTTPGEHGRVVVLAEVPAMELVRFPLDLRSLAHGTGIFRRSELGFQPGGAAETSS